MDEDIEVDKKPENWKNKLSPAFNEEEILYSVFVLGIFYVVYAIVKGFFDVLDNSADDEERFVQSCFCSLNQRIFYRFWFYFCFAVWFFIHSLNFFAQLFVKRFHKIKAFCTVCLYGVYKKCLCKNKEPSYEKDKIKLVRKNISLIWFQYYKLHVIGYAKYYDKIPSIKIIMNDVDNGDTDSETDNGDTDSETDNGDTDSEIDNEDTDSEIDKRGCCFLECNQRGENVTCTHPCCCLRRSERCWPRYRYRNKCEPIDTCPDVNIMCCNEYFPNRCLSKDIIRVILLSVKYLSQLATVPLLLLQIFDTYSFLCFSPDSYCSHTTEYNQHIVQAAITLFFYCSLVISHLTSTLLIWNPWPKHDEQTNNLNLVKTVRKETVETINDKIPWTIYFLIDLKVAYIITFGLITIINLISSTAYIHAFTDKSSMMLFNVSSKYMNVNVTSINDPILWNCRKFSDTSDSYKFLYWMVIIVLIVIMSGLFSIKFISLTVVNSVCEFKCCTNVGSTFKHGLTKLWYIAIHQEVIDSVLNQTINDDINSYDNMLKKNIPDDVIKTLSYTYKNYYRSIIPYILLFLSVAIMCLAYFSFDLHPLACLVEPDEELITYKESKVELKISISLLIYQKIGGFLVLFLGPVFLIFAGLFFYYTKQVIKELQKHVTQEKLKMKEEL